MRYLAYVLWFAAFVPGCLSLFSFLLAILLYNASLWTGWEALTCYLDVPSASDLAGGYGLQGLVAGVVSVILTLSGCWCKDCA